MDDGMDCLPGMSAVEASMPGKSTLTADATERAALRDLSKSEQRGEADRARTILLTLEGRHAGEIAAVLGVHVSTMRNWRGEPPLNWWTPLLSSEGSGRVSNGPGTASSHG